MSKVKVRFFGEARIKLKMASDSFEVDTVKELLQCIWERYNVLTVKELKNFLIFINNVSVIKLKMYGTKLCDGDEIMLLSPASGG